MELIAVMTTTDSPEEARQIATALVDRRLAACVHIEEIDSVYTWEGVTQSDREYRLFIKTTQDRYAAVEAAILDLHSYDLPAIYALELEHAYAPYADWVAENSAETRNRHSPGVT